MHPTVPPSPHGFVLARTARSQGLESVLRIERDAGRLVAIRRGVHEPPATRPDPGAAAAHRRLALAVSAQRADPVFAGPTAAVVHGLPLLGAPPDDVFLLARGLSGRHRNGVLEVPRRGFEHIVDVDGLQTVSIPDALIEAARRLPLLGALGLLDAALWAPRDGAEPRCRPADLARALEARLPFPGSKRVRVALARASSSSESPLETLSRFRFHEAGVPEPEQQLVVPLPGGRIAHLDFAWPDRGVWGEADGHGKYLGAGARDARHAVEIVLAEKRREDEIRRVTGWACVRWDWHDAWACTPLLQALRTAGITPR